MGCDFYWEASEEDIFRQRKCGWFLESLFDADGNGNSQYFGSGWKCETFNGYFNGYFLDIRKPKKTPELSTVHLVGTTIYCGDLSELDGWMNGDAGRQFSFVFENENHSPPKLITIEFISDLSKPKYEWLQESFNEISDNNPDLHTAIYRTRGYDRLLEAQGWLATLFYSIKKQFLPKLDVSDDYLFFESVTNENPTIPKEFSENICKPSLAKKWGFG